MMKCARTLGSILLLALGSFVFGFGAATSPVGLSDISAISKANAQSSARLLADLGYDGNWQAIASSSVGETRVGRWASNDSGLMTARVTISRDAMSIRFARTGENYVNVKCVSPRLRTPGANQLATFEGYDSKTFQGYVLPSPDMLECASGWPDAPTYLFRVDADHFILLWQGDATILFRRAGSQAAPALKPVTLGDAPAGSCRSQIGDKGAKLISDICSNMSPATRPPCHPDNSCRMIRDEIGRGCRYAGKTAPAYCKNGMYQLIGMDKNQLRAAVATPKSIVGAWAPEATNCETDTGFQFRADGTFEENMHFGSWSFGARNLLELSYTGEHTDELPAPKYTPWQSKMLVLIPDRETLLILAKGQPVMRYMSCKY